MMNVPQKLEEGKTWKQVNKEHYDSVPADLFDIPWVRKLHLQIIDYLTENREWLGISKSASFENGNGIRILDYACGNGVLSLALAPYAAQLRGIDISSTMVQRYNENAEKSSLAPERMRAVEADIAAGDPELATAAAGAEFQGFDLALVSMAMHHMEHPDVVLKAMAERLAPGGRILVIDWETPTEEQIKTVEAKKAARQGDGHDHAAHEGHAHDHGHGHGHGDAKAPGGLHTVVHRGFTEKQILDMFSGAGLVNGEFRRNPELSDMPPEIGAQMQIFYGVAQKAKD